MRDRAGGDSLRLVENRRSAGISAVLLLFAVLFAAPPAEAHDFRVTPVTVVLAEDGAFEARLGCDLDALALGVSASEDDERLKATLEAMPPAELEEHLQGLQRQIERRVRLRFDDMPVPFAVELPEVGRAEDSYLGLEALLLGQVPAGAETFSFFASRTFPPVQLEVRRAGAEAGASLILQAGERSTPLRIDELELPPAAGEVAWRYLRLGFWHILPAGLDHILFVLGLFLLAARWRPLLIQVTAFTAAHTLTLALATYGWVSLPSRPVEALIALSIVAIAVENLLTTRLRPARLWIVFLFGLLHGLGFAGVLGELGLPRGHALLGLVTFNVGVELGQIAVLLAAFAVLGVWRSRPWYRSRITIPLSLAIGFVGLYWAVERILGG